MHASISALDIYPNVRTLLGMIVGLALAHMLTQFARIIEFIRAALIATRTHNVRYHQAFALVAFAYQLAWIVRRYEVFG